MNGPDGGVADACGYGLAYATCGATQPEPLDACSLEECANLTSLRMTETYSPLVFGTVPPALGSMSWLSGHFELWGLANVTGTLPPSLGSLAALQSFFEVARLGVTGTVPPSLGSLAGLRQRLQLNELHLSGTLPASLGSLAGLGTDLVLYSLPRLSGTLPPSLGSLTALGGRFYLWNLPGVTGTLPASLGSLTALGGELWVQDLAGLTGTVPSSLGSLAALSEYLYLRNCPRCTGTLPASLGSLRSLARGLKLYDLPGVGGALPASLGSLGNLASSLWLRNIGATGTLPSSFGSLTRLQSMFVVHSAPLTGTLPASLANLRALSFQLGVAGTQLTGTIPPAIASLTALQRLDLSNNSFTGPVSLPCSTAAFGRVVQLVLTSVDLAYNALSALPLNPSADADSELCLSPVLLLALNVSHNGLDGSPLPSALGSYANLRLFNASAAGFGGTVPPAVGSLGWLQSLDLSANAFTGTLPSSLGSLSHLTALKLSSNELEAQLPASICSLTGLFTAPSAGGPRCDLSYSAFGEGSAVAWDCSHITCACAADLRTACSVDADCGRTCTGNATTTGPFGNQTDDLIARVGISAAIVLVVVAIIAIVAHFTRRKKNLRHHMILRNDSRGHLLASTMGHPLVGPAVGVLRPTAEILTSLERNLDMHCSRGRWTAVEAMATDVRDLRAAAAAHADVVPAGAADNPGNASARADVGVDVGVGDPRQLLPAAAALVAKAVGVLRESIAEQKVLLGAAVAGGDYNAVSCHSKRMTMLEESLAQEQDVPGGGDGGGSGQFECVAPGVLLRKDRFSGSSDAFLGRGASAAVSRGVLVELIGTKEVRTVVAVKEVPKTSAVAEQAAMRELLLLKKKLRTPHPNIIRMYDVKAGSAMFYVIMQCCLFSLDRQPEAFQDFLHASPAGSADDVVGSAMHTGSAVLGALVEDALRGLGFLHSKHIMHCDIKVGNLLVDFNRPGRRHEFMPENFHLAQLVIADFGVSRVLQSQEDQASTGSSGSGAEASVTMVGLPAGHGVQGTEAFMSPEMLALLRRQRRGRGARGVSVDDPTEAMLVGNDTFGCGCAIAYLCSRGLHPFASAFHASVADNILAYRRLPLRQLGIRNPRHLQLVDKFTQKDPESRWTVLQALAQERVFGVSGPRGAATAADDTRILLDDLEIRKRPSGSCREELLQLPAPVSGAATMPDTLRNIDNKVAELREHPSLPVKLDEDSLTAIVAYTIESSGERSSNIYFALNQALRARQQDPAALRPWRGFLYFLLRALDKLPKLQLTVYRGGNAGIDQQIVNAEYTLGRPIQWAGFSSTSVSLRATKEFVRKDEGVVFKLAVVSGRDLGRFSYYSTESEVLLAPSTRLVVTREMYRDEDGYACVDLSEVQGNMLSS